LKVHNNDPKKLIGIPDNIPSTVAMFAFNIVSPKIDSTERLTKRFTAIDIEYTEAYFKTCVEALLSCALNVMFLFIEKLYEIENAIPMALEII
jgi:hypothetical protein